MQGNRAPVRKPAVPGGAGPKRVGAVDVGSNSMRFVAAEASPEVFRVLATTRLPVRLGRDAFSRGELAPTTMDAAVSALVSFARELNALGVETSRTVGTAALRECRNRDELGSRVRLEAGLALEVIPGVEEIRLV